MYFLGLFLLFSQTILAQEFVAQIQSDIENIGQQIEEYQQTDEAQSWQEKHDANDLQSLEEKYKKRKVRQACGLCPRNNFIEGVVRKRLSFLLSNQLITKNKWSRLTQGLYYLSYHSTKNFKTYSQYQGFLNTFVKNHFLLDQHTPESLKLENKQKNIKLYIYKTHELIIEVYYNYSDIAEIRIYQIQNQLLNSPEIILKKYNFQDPKFHIVTELSFQKFVDYQGKFLSFHSDVKVGAKEFLTELDYQLKNSINGELVFSGTNDNTETTIRHNLKTGSSSKISIYLTTYYLERMTAEQRSKAIIVDGSELRQNFIGLEWQWIFDSK